VLPAEAEDYEKRVAGATDALNAFYGRLISELDVQNGAFSWWSGHCDWKTLTLIGDYLIQSVRGVSDALVDASFAARTYREFMFADSEAMKKAARDGNSPFPFNAASRRRQHSITQSQESCLYHLGQTLDRLAAAVIIIGGFEVKDVAKVDWGSLEDIADDLAAGSTKQMLEPLGSSGRATQIALIAPIAGWQQAGPDDWLPWLRSTRNGMTHRAPGQKMVTLNTTSNRLTRLFYREPLWSDLQSIIFGARPPRTTFYDSFVMTASEDILDGLCESMSAFIEAITKVMVACWDDRKADPQMIIQHGRQWRVVEPTGAMSNFPGYGAPVTLASDAMMRMSALDTRRWQAARAMDDRRRDWY
jgi:hypothetical protein